MTGATVLTTSAALQPVFYKVCTRHVAPHAFTASGTMRAVESVSIQADDCSVDTQTINFYTQFILSN